MTRPELRERLLELIYPDVTEHWSRPEAVRVYAVDVTDKPLPKRYTRRILRFRVPDEMLDQIIIIRRARP
ncbi:hypothetical protein AGMMS49992_25840 [Clostridia bacterium]|nr:hypothetical protein AGMMS49992_25840 [Clostridia bacterium]